MTTEEIHAQYEAQKCWGMVASINVYHCDREAISNPEQIYAFIKALCDSIDMVRHGEPHIERFAEGALEGYSAMQFIETSSVTMHFDEGENRAFVDIFSCKYFDYQKAEVFCREFLKGTESNALYYFRK
jgi:S-adenosylmethionine decarboxylase